MRNPHENHETHHEEGGTYRVIPQTAPLPASETDTEAEVTEVIVMWGDNVLHVAHVESGCSFVVGEPGADAGADSREGDEHEPTREGERDVTDIDFVIDARTLGTRRWSLLRGGSGGFDGSVVVLPKNARYVLEQDGDASMATSMEHCTLARSTALGGARELELRRSMSLCIEHAGFTFFVRKVASGRVLGKEVDGALFDPRKQAWLWASFCAHALLLGLMYFLPPKASGLQIDSLHEDPRYARYLITPQVLPDEPLPVLLDTPKSGDESEPGKKHEGDQGQMGDKHAPKTKNAHARKGPHDNENPELAKNEAREQAATAGIIGILRANVGSWSSPTSPFGRDAALGRDPSDALGRLLGDAIGTSFGWGGLGPSGTGRGGGGDGRGTIGTGEIGTVGRGGEGGPGYGTPGGLRDHHARVPKIKVNPPEVMGSLSKEVIRRVINRQISAVRHCYTQSLNARPDLQGRVAVKFVIAPSGAVQRAVIGKSELGHAETEDCIAGVVGRLTFPAPEGGGLVVVTYPFVLQQAGN